MRFRPIRENGDVVVESESAEAFDHSDAELARDRHVLEEMICAYAVQACEVLLDDETVTGTFLAVHVMNLSSIGPNLRLAPGADPSDGWLDIVLVRDGEQEQFADFVTAERRGKHLEARFPVRQSRSVRLRWEGAEVHVDDEFYQPGEPAELRAYVVPGELTFLRTRRR
jgi:diacylglycerol kinase family enzyme